MYTGWISEIGEVVERADDRLAVRAPKSSGQLALGRSINVAGVCLSVEWIEGDVQATAALARAVRNAPWAGALSGALGVEKSCSNSRPAAWSWSGTPSAKPRAT